MPTVLPEDQVSRSIPSLYLRKLTIVCQSSSSESSADNYPHMQASTLPPHTHTQNEQKQVIQKQQHLFTSPACKIQPSPAFYTFHLHSCSIYYLFICLLTLGDMFTPRISGNGRICFRSLQNRFLLLHLWDMKSFHILLYVW